MTRALLQLALDALVKHGAAYLGHQYEYDETIETIRAHLAKPQGEPVAVVTGLYGGRFTFVPVDRSAVLPQGMALYTHPAHTEQDVQELIRWYVDSDLAPFSEAVRRILGVPAP